MCSINKTYLLTYLLKIAMPLQHSRPNNNAKWVYVSKIHRHFLLSHQLGGAHLTHSDFNHWIQITGQCSSDIVGWAVGLFVWSFALIRTFFFISEPYFESHINLGKVTNLHLSRCTKLILCPHSQRTSIYLTHSNLIWQWTFVFHCGSHHQVLPTKQIIF